MAKKQNALALLQDGVQMLARCRTMQDASQLAALAEGAEIYAKRAKLGNEAIGYAHTINIDALTLLGDMLKKTPRAKGRAGKGRPHLGASARDAPKKTASNIPTLAELEITHKEAAKAKKLAKLKKSRKRLHESVRSGDKTVTQAQRIIKESEREKERKANEKKVSEGENIADFQGLFATILIDPPWDWGDEKDVNQMGRAKPNYKTMTREELLDLPVGDWAGKDCHIYSWVTNRSMPKVFDLLEEWGFRYVTLLTWPKPSFGMGNYFRGQTEHIAFGVKGSQQLSRKNASTLLPTWPRGKQHSSKPIECYEFIESCSPGPYLEVFGRGSKRDGWVIVGADAI